MKFNIKNWQDKHLITESKSLKKEIDFKSPDAFKKYNAKHKMRATTKVNIAGKDTTAGEASGKEKKAATPTSTKGRDIHPEEFGEILNGMDQEAQTYYDDGAQEDLLNKMNDAFEDANLFDGDEPITYDKVAAALDDTGLVNDDDREHLKTQMKDKFEVEEEGGDDDYGDDDDDDDYDDDDGDDDYDDDDDWDAEPDPEDILANAKVAYENGLMDKEEWDNTREDYDDDDEYSDEALGADGYFWANDDAKADHEKQSGTKQDTDAADGPAVPFSGKKESVTPKSSRIQEATIYKTIQELRALEKGI